MSDATTRLKASSISCHRIERSIGGVTTPSSIGLCPSTESKCSGDSFSELRARSAYLRPVDRIAPVLDQRGQLLVAALGFAGCSMPAYDRALWALRTWPDSWTG